MENKEESKREKILSITYLSFLTISSFILFGIIIYFLPFPSSLIALIIPILISHFLIGEPLAETVITSIIFFVVFYFAISSYKDYNNRKNKFGQGNTSSVVQKISPIKC